MIMVIMFLFNMYMSCLIRETILYFHFYLLIVLHFLQQLYIILLQKVVGDQHGLQVSQPTVCRTIHRVSEALAKRYSQFVRFPSVHEAADIHSK